MDLDGFVMMNSMRASPTPSFGRKLVWKAMSGLPMLIMIWVAGRGIAEIDVLTHRTELFLHRPGPSPFRT